MSIHVLTIWRVVNKPSINYYTMSSNMFSEFGLVLVVLKMWWRVVVKLSINCYTMSSIMVCAFRLVLQVITLYRVVLKMWWRVVAKLSINCYTMSSIMVCAFRLVLQVIPLYRVVLKMWWMVVAKLSINCYTMSSIMVCAFRLVLQGSPENVVEGRRQAVYQLLHNEQQYVLCLQFGIARFLLPLSERRDVISPQDHSVLFQNAQELLRLTEDVLEMMIQEEGDRFGSSVGRIFLRKMSAIISGYRRYCSGLKKADCLLVEKTRNSAFMRIITEPPVPRRRPDLTTFVHKPLEHFRDLLKLLQTIQNNTPPKDDDYPAISRVVQEFQTAYRDITVESGLMEPEVEGRPLLSLQDLESRLVFTRCKPFVLSSPGRQWIFGGDLSRVEGRSVRSFWALLFTDLLLFAKVSRDRVLFVTEEPLSLLTVSQALFSIRKKGTVIIRNKYFIKV
ncbi:hypothetical protein J6590_013067 [Homalodisca vitripennis]|nr:hypothetical protein J6590_013067 [Homalodisca vitripennis]